MLKSALSGNVINTPLYSSNNNQSITSLGQIYSGETVVYLDKNIGHIQTKEIEGIDKYYDEDYHFFDQSEEDDILYSVVDGKKIFRQEHQVNTLLGKIPFYSGMNVLDYGCAKGTVMKRLMGLKSDVKVHLYDVSRMYENLWSRFIPISQYCSYQVKSEWVGHFDVVTSFFAFEHTPDPLKELAIIKGLLKDNGLVYIVVPNVFENPADFIVADHVHHYSELSLRYMLAKAGFETIDIDDKVHFAAFVVIAKKTPHNSIDYIVEAGQLAFVNQAFFDMANRWKNLKNKIRSFEEENLLCHSAIYGAGVYGNFIATSLQNLGSVVCFIDQNPLLHDTKLFDLDVILPEKLPKNVEIVYVGLNPKIAKGVMNDLIAWAQKDIQFFYI
ncbi:MAG: methyltransferase domain-containing protein [Methylomarinum sp.]|nr:methyltransferase domain-containing protein [Methylomarinum sp.]